MGASRQPALAVALPILALFCPAVLALDPGPLFRTEVYVTGQREETRRPALAQAFKDVLVKVAGDPGLAEDARVEEMAEQSRSFVLDYRYRDRMEGIPLHDEQGSRDRPYELTVDFHPERIEAALAQLGRKAWTGERPRVVVLLAVEQEGTSYVLASDGDHGQGQREAWAATARKFALPILLPSAHLLKDAGLDFESLQDASLSELERLPGKAGGDALLFGSMIWKPEELGWAAEWQLARKGRVDAWQVRGVNFDAAFRNAASGALRILSGQAVPP